MIGAGAGGACCSTRDGSPRPEYMAHMAETAWQGGLGSRIGDSRKSKDDIRKSKDDIRKSKGAIKMSEDTIRKSKEPAHLSVQRSVLSVDEDEIQSLGQLLASPGSPEGGGGLGETIFIQSK